MRHTAFLPNWARLRALWRSRAHGTVEFPWEPLPHQRSPIPGSPASPDHPLRRRIAYGLIAALVGITGGLGSAIVSSNLTTLQGELNLTPTQAAWLPTVYVMTNVVANLLLIKFRQQYGMRLFVQIFLVGYVLATAAHLLVHSFASALIVRAASGFSAAALSTLALLYMMQAFPAKWRLKGLVIAVGIPQLALPIARLFPSEPPEAAQWQTFYLFELGLALLSLAAVRFLVLPPTVRTKPFEKLDFVTFAFFAPGIGLLCAALGLGRVVWWTQAPWIGWALAGSMVLLPIALMIEHRRKNPLLNTRWLGSGDILRFAIVATLTRIVLAEQSTGAVGLLQFLGMGNDQLRTLYLVILAASIAGMTTSAILLNPNFLGRPILVALALIAIGSFMDWGASNLTRPPQMYLSQAILGYAALVFIGPALLIGLTRALAAGPGYFVSFSALFGVTQSLGGLAGSALIGSFQIIRQRVHLLDLGSQITLANPIVAARVAQSGQSGGRLIGDPALRGAEGGAMVVQTVSREASILAYNDVFLLIGFLALATMFWASIHIYRIQRDKRRAAAAAAVVAAAPKPAMAR